MIERSLDVEILFISSKTSEPKLKEIKFDKYKIHSVPTARESINDSRESFLLEFCDSWKSGQMSSNPEKEGDYILSLLSLMLQTKINFDSMKINNVQATIKRRRSSFLNGRMDFPPDSGARSQLAICGHGGPPGEPYSGVWGCCACLN